MQRNQKRTSDAFYNIYYCTLKQASFKIKPKSYFPFTHGLFTEQCTFKLYFYTVRNFFFTEQKNCSLVEFFMK